LLGRTTCLVPDAPETPQDPALGPLVSDVVVSGSINGNGSVRDVYCTSDSLLFLFSQAVTTPLYYLPGARRRTSPRKHHLHSSPFSSLSPPSYDAARFVADETFLVDPSFSGLVA
jgi:hypothetical protein